MKVCNGQYARGRIDVRVWKRLLVDECVRTLISVPGAFAVIEMALGGCPLIRSKPFSGGLGSLVPLRM